MSKLNRFIETRGFEALQQTLNNLASDKKRKLLLAALRKAVKPTLEAAQSNAPKRTGELAESFAIMSDSKEIAVIVGARRSKTMKGYRAVFFDNDRGFSERFRKNGGSTGTLSAAKPYYRFFTKAVKSTEEKAVKTVAEEWQKMVARMMVKNASIDRW